MINLALQSGRVCLGVCLAGRQNVLDHSTVRDKEHWGVAGENKQTALQFSERRLCASVQKEPSADHFVYSTINLLTH